MSINRISSGFLTNQSVTFLNTNLGILSDLQQKLASGKNINQPSDDPVGLTKILSLSNEISTDERYTRNIESAIAEVDLADTVLSNITELVHRAKDLAVQGATFTGNQDGRDALALEVDQIISQLVQLGNTNLAGKYVFGGKATASPPFNRAVGSDDVTYSGNAPATAWQRPIEISRGVELDVNINGENLLGQVQVTAVGPPPTYSAASNGLFHTLVQLKLNLEQGDISTTGVAARLDELDLDLNNVLAEQAKIGSITNRLELTQSRIEERNSILTQQFSDIQNVDMAKLVSELNFQENVFQGSLATTARVLQTSLINFLR